MLFHFKLSNIRVWYKAQVSPVVQGVDCAGRFWFPVPSAFVHHRVQLQCCWRFPGRLDSCPHSPASRAGYTFFSISKRCLWRHSNPHPLYKSKAQKSRNFFLKLSFRIQIIYLFSLSFIFRFYITSSYTPNMCFNLILKCVLFKRW